jgi:hypothetical protein
MNRLFSRARAAIVALMLAPPPVYAQAGGGQNSASSDATTTITTTSHGLFGLHLSWIAVGAVVLVVLIGLVAMSGNRTTTTTIRRE